MSWLKFFGIGAPNPSPPEPTVVIPQELGAELLDILAQDVGKDMEVSRVFALALYRELKVFCEEMGGCDHNVGICSCNEVDAVHRLGVLLRQEYPLCLFCDCELPAFSVTLHPQCEGSYHAGLETD